MHSEVIVQRSQEIWQDIDTGASRPYVGGPVILVVVIDNVLDNAKTVFQRYNFVRCRRAVCQYRKIPQFDAIDSDTPLSVKRCEIGCQDKCLARIK